MIRIFIIFYLFSCFQAVFANTKIDKPLNNQAKKVRKPKYYSCKIFLKVNCELNDKLISIEDKILCLNKLDPNKMTYECIGIKKKITALMARRTKLNYKIKKFIKENRFKFLILLFIIIWLQYSFSLVLMKIGKNPINAFIPGYNFYLFHRMAGVPLSWCFFNMTPTLFYYWPKTCVSFAKNFGKEKNFGYLLALLPVIFLYDLGNENVLKFQQNHHDNDDLDL